ncbi:MAG: hypothetical protein KDE14_07620 [Rhodobacteraceae bacterium]|nr:hypothetical protein [Paracoccaceae bacterium]
MYIAHFQDHPGTLHLRRSHADDHAAYLAQHRDTIAGETHRFCDDLGNPYGAMWLINTTERRVALSLCHDDPYWKLGVRKDVTLVRWMPSPYDLRVAHA